MVIVVVVVVVIVVVVIVFVIVFVVVGIFDIILWHCNLYIVNKNHWVHKMQLSRHHLLFISFYFPPSK